MARDIPDAGELIGTSKVCHTWYKIYGDLNSGKRPLVVLHGGPGASSPVVSTFSTLTVQHSIPVIIYDQLGCGRSSHFRYKAGDAKFINEQLLLDELKDLLIYLKIYDNYDLIGNSWGGMFAARHAARQPGGLKRLSIMSGPASMELWAQAQMELLRTLPQDIQDTINTAEREGTTDSQEYTEATDTYYSFFFCRVDPTPQPLQLSLANIVTDPTVYHTMNGPNEIDVNGPLRSWSMIDEAKNISVPTLLINGVFDQCTDACMQPYFDLIPNVVGWERFANSSHMAHLEEPEKFFKVVGEFFNVE